MRTAAAPALLVLVVLLGACGDRGTAPPPPPAEPPLDLPAGPDIRLNTDGAGRALSVVPQFCCEGDRIHAVWYDDRNGQPDIYFNRSLDGGVSWLASDLRIDTDPPGAAHSRDPRICCAADEARVVWYDQRDGPGDVYFNRVRLGP